MGLGGVRYISFNKLHWKANTVSTAHRFVYSTDSPHWHKHVTSLLLHQRTYAVLSFWYHLEALVSGGLWGSTHWPYYEDIQKVVYVAYSHWDIDEIDTTVQERAAGTCCWCGYYHPLLLRQVLRLTTTGAATTTPTAAAVTTAGRLLPTTTAATTNGAGTHCCCYKCWCGF